MTRRLLPLLVLLLLAALAAPGSALALDQPQFSVAPENPDVNETISLSITNLDPTVVSYNWTYTGGGGDVGSDVTTSFDTPGDKTITVTASNGVESSENSRIITVVEPPPTPPVNTKPTARFSVSDTEPMVGETITVTSTSDDPEGDQLRCLWSWDGPATVAQPGECTTTITWSGPGLKEVTLRVTDPGNLFDEKLRTIRVRTVPAPTNQLPNAPSLSFSPAAPVAGEPVTFTSKATDPDGNIETYEWDFNSDKVYEATGETASHVFPTSGNYTVTVRATDNNGGFSTSFQTIFVSSPPAGEVLGTSNSGSPPTAPTQSSGQGQPRPTTARLLSPFPIVRLRGSVAGRTASINLLSVQGAPRGAKVRVRCRGGGCPRKLVTSTALSSRNTMRLRAFERRLRAGAKLEIYITQSGRLGKYTRFEIRRNAAPRRTDRCVRSYPGKPFTCPTTA
jgi:hypothetical protein